MSATSRKAASAGLTPAQLTAISTILERCEQNNWSQRALQQECDGFVAIVDNAFTDDTQLFALGDWLAPRVRWTRLPGYYLAFVYQRVVVQRPSAAFIWAASLYADAQVVVGDDLAISSLESAYAVAQRTFPLEAALIDGLRLRLKLALEFYEQFRRRFAFASCNPLSEHLYSQYSFHWLREARGETNPADIDPRYASIVAHRFDGYAQEGKGDYGRALAEYDAGLAEAREASLEPEIGHLLRSRGFALRSLGRHAESVAAFHEACEWEAAPVFTYWRALSQHELGLSLKYLDQSPEGLRQALAAFKKARTSLETSLATGMPEVSAVAQELARVFNENALDVAVALQDPMAILETTEACGPRQVTDAVAEASPSFRPRGLPAEEFRKARAGYHRQMNAFSGGIGNYLAALPQHYEFRKKYLHYRQQMTALLAIVHNSELAARQLLKKPVPGSVFVLPHVGMHRSWVTAVDMDARRIATLWSDEFTVAEADKAYEDFRNGCLASGSSPGDLSGQLAAVQRLIETYQRWLAPLLEKLLNGTTARRLKFFPRESLHPLPLHALRFGDGLLADRFEVSYGQTLGLWHLGRERAAQAQPSTGLLVVNAGGLLFYEAALDEWAPLRKPSWQAFRSAVESVKPANILFACHGSFDPAEPGNSRLHIDGAQGASFYQIFEDLDLSTCRGVILGACDSGLARSRVGAESCGLQMAFLAAGAGNVVAAQWPVNQLATALLTEQLARNLASYDLTESLLRAQQWLRDVTAGEVAGWLETRFAMVNPSSAPRLAAAIRKKGPHPFAHPYYWAGFTSMGRE